MKFKVGQLVKLNQKYREWSKGTVGTVTYVELILPPLVLEKDRLIGVHVAGSSNHHITFECCQHRLSPYSSQLQFNFMYE